MSVKFKKGDRIYYVSHLDNKVHGIFDWYDVGRQRVWADWDDDGFLAHMPIDMCFLDGPVIKPVKGIVKFLETHNL